MGVAHRDLIRLTTVGRDDDLAMDQLEHQGWTRTAPADPEENVTDSAAAATALATGVSTANGMIAVDAEQKVLTTVLERAQESGRSTGLVTTSRVTDATPAAFGAHTSDRDDHSGIALQYLEETGVDVILGGGEDKWLPAGTEGAWPDGAEADGMDVSDGTEGDLVERAQRLGYQYVSDRDGLAGADGEKVLGLFANEEMFEEDEGQEAGYDPVVPLPQMAAKAFELLSRDEEGFFLLIEEEAIDAMSHRQEAGLLIDAGRAFDETVALARDFAADEGETLIVVVGDHETGGLALEPSDPSARSEDETFPIVGTDLQVDVDWATTRHTGASTPVSAEGPGAEALVGVRHHRDVHDLMSEAMGL